MVEDHTNEQQRLLEQVVEKDKDFQRAEEGRDQENDELRKRIEELSENGMQKSGLEARVSSLETQNKSLTERNQELRDKIDKQREDIKKIREEAEIELQDAKAKQSISTQSFESKL